MAARTIDLNADLGEGMGDDEAMLAIVTSVNVACGAHAGDEDSMVRTLAAAARHGVVVGAHPGYEDRANFGRRELELDPDDVGQMVVAQVEVLRDVATRVSTDVRYVKLHGALANQAARDVELAEAVVGAVRRYDSMLAVLAISGTELEHAARRAGLAVYSEIFADRGYRSTGHLVPRNEPGAMLRDPDLVADRIVGALDSGRVPVVDGEPIELAAHSVCVHGDSDAAVVMARELRRRLADAGVILRSFVEP